MVPKDELVGCRNKQHQVHVTELARAGALGGRGLPSMELADIGIDGS